MELFFFTDLPRGDAVELTVDCSQSYSPVVTYSKINTDVGDILSIDYQCTDGFSGIWVSAQHTVYFKAIRFNP